MHLIPRRAARRVLVLLIAMGGLLAVPAFAFAHSDLSLIKVGRQGGGRPRRPAHLHARDPAARHARQRAGDGDGHAAAVHDVREQLGGLHGRRRRRSPARSAPVAVGQVVTITITVRVDDDVPAGDLLNIADVTAPGDTPTDNNHGSAITVVNFAGLGDFVWWDQNHNGLQDAGEPGLARRDAAHLRRLRARSSARPRPTPRASTASTGCDRRRPTPSASTPPTARRAARSRASS